MPRNRNVRLWLLTDMNGRSDYVRFTPESGHAITDVRFTVDFVRFTPNSGHKPRW